MANEVLIHTIEPIVTRDRFELGVHRLRVPGGWIYWLSPMNGSSISEFVPDYSVISEEASAIAPAPGLTGDDILRLAREIVGLVTAPRDRGEPPIAPAPPETLIADEGVADPLASGAQGADLVSAEARGADGSGSNEADAQTGA